MAKGDDGGPAYPRPGFYAAGMNDMPVDDMREAAAVTTDPQPGMSLRDWFAGQAMVGLLAFSPSDADTTGQMRPERAAEDAYLFADAMLKRRAGK